ncbi:hypothetical protein R3W88_011509 [Solanum pinnatisectum]|uniref:Retrotransposon gag domain-containing protein n=1 Tax=Solanum pinnatisectum TaxID=50273 RepID=A0AAV9L6R8_9SOLN|nr:hypothetical protein R3W88_011509 [Solanum pinnatisectum]
MMYEEDDLDLDGAGATRVIVLPALPPSVKFTITSTMIQLLNVKGMFKGVAGDDANQHLMNFVAICKSQEILGVSQTTMRLRLFPLSLTGEEAFLERFFPESKVLQMKDEISAYKHLPGEAMHDTWWRFNQKLKKCLNHGLTERHLKQAIYRSLNYVTKHVADADIDLDEEANYLGNQGGFQNYNLGNQGYNFGNAGRNYSRKGQYDRPANKEQGNWPNRDGYRNDRSGVYVPPGNKDRASDSSSKSKLEDMLAKVLQKVESTDAGKDRHCMAIATRSGKILTDPLSTGTKHEQVLEQAGREKDEAEQVDDLEDT